MDSKRKQVFFFFLLLSFFVGIKKDSVCLFLSALKVLDVKRLLNQIKKKTKTKKRNKDQDSFFSKTKEIRKPQKSQKLQKPRRDTKGKGKVKPLINLLLAVQKKF